MNHDDEDYYEYSDEEDQLESPPSGSQDDYKIGETLRPPRGTSYSVHHLYAQLNGREIDLSAVYQRDVVWDDEKQIAIIDSIFRNYYVPPVIFSVKAFDDGTEVRHCVDGKQRLTSIRRFMDGEIPHKDTRTKERVWFKNNPQFGPARKKILPEGVKDTFMKKQIVCVEFEGLTFDQERDIFQRVQMGVPLTPPEKLNVIFTPRANLTRDLITTTFGNREGIGREIEEKEVDFDPRRGRGFHVVTLASRLLTKWNLETGVRTLPGIPALETWLKESKSGGVVGVGRKRKRKGKEKAATKSGDDEAVDVPQEFRERMMKAAKTIVQLVKDPRYAMAFRSMHFAQKVSPIEMTGILVLIYLLHERGQLVVTMERLSALIVLLRADMHQKHPKSARLNTPCWQTVLAFILDAVKDPEGFWKAKVDDGEVAWAGIQVSVLKRPRKKEDDKDYTPPKKGRTDADPQYLPRLKLASTRSAPSPPPPQSPPMSELQMLWSPPSSSSPSTTTRVRNPSAGGRSAGGGG
ncbi:hypothetical protein Moror_9142 [Moniliophthora roreri MCA 2997]|uniref:GmrSD restriction endonucleases N-terminal domain-containing protein n=1 Tax=Moniliophthora roreri (strain MCA 2997) TaxID=1381753 RepID=V2YMB1_MONRO|nr:hypothetical protein Moror_9142 [Moniliophthora roreri MCA 2997]